MFVHSPAGKLPAGNEFLPGFLSSPDRNFTEQGKERLNHMKLLEERIRQEGIVKSGSVLKVDSFINHQMDVLFFDKMGAEFKRLYADAPINKILTIEASGIGIAIIAGLHFGVPVVFAKKSRSSNISDDVYHTVIHSYTHNNDNNVIVSREYLSPEDHLLIIDDFLANGCAMEGLIDLAHQAGATVEGLGIAVEKGSVRKATGWNRWRSSSRWTPPPVRSCSGSRTDLPWIWKGESSMEIRHLTPAEIPQGLELVRDVFLEFEAPDYPPEGVEEFFRFLNDPQQASLCFYGAWDGTVLRGVLAAREEHICLLFVRREYHRQGTARALIEAYCREQTGAVTVNSSPYAVEAYHRLGFRDTAPQQTVNGITFTPMIREV